MMTTFPNHFGESEAERLERGRQRATERCKQAKELSLVDWFAKHTNTLTDRLIRGRHYSEWCPSCGTSSKANRKVYIENDETWSCFACDEHGDIVTAEKLVGGGRDGDAAKRLLGISDGAAVTGQVLQLKQTQESAQRLAQREAETRKHEAVAQAIRLICSHTKEIRDPAVLKYLTGTDAGERGIPLKVVELAIERNILRTLPASPAMAAALIRSIVPESILRAAELWKDDQSIPWIAYRPLWFVAPGATSAELRIARSARDGESKSLKIGPKHRPYFWEGTRPEGCAVVEGGPDFLALIALGYEGDIMGLQGTRNWDLDWFPRVVAARGTKRFDTILDNDFGWSEETFAARQDERRQQRRDSSGPKRKSENPGQEAAIDLGDHLLERKIPWKNILLPQGDINDHWLKKLKSL